MKEPIATAALLLFAPDAMRQAASSGQQVDAIQNLKSPREGITGAIISDRLFHRLQGSACNLKSEI